MLAFFVISNSGARGTVHYDNRRYADLAQARSLLEIFYSQNGKYPGNYGNNQWNVLTQELQSGDFLYEDPCNKFNPQWKYDYRVSGDGQSYVIKANFQLHLSILNDDNVDLDGDILGINCGQNGYGEREYCVGF